MRNTIVRPAAAALTLLVESARSGRRGVRSLPFLGLVILAACSPPPVPSAVRLVDVFHDATIDGGSGEVETPGRTEWKFDSGDAGWRSLRGVTGLEVRNGQLHGRATDRLPLLVVQAPSGLDDTDMLYGVEVRVWASGGANVSLHVSSLDRANVTAISRDARAGNWDMSSPLLPSDEPQTYRITTTRSIRASSIRQVVLRPTDEAGAEFAVESVRLIFRSEYLAGIPSGVSWQPLSEIYRETIVTRAPQTARFDVTLPAKPWLDLTVGTIEDKAVRFRVAVDDAIIEEHEITRPHEWEDMSVDLSGYGGKSVTLSLSLESDTAGTLGFWGAPAVRSHGAIPVHAEAADPPQGVLYIICDSLRRDHLEVYGYDRSTAPTVAHMAATGTLFLDDQAQADWTKASVPSNLSSRYQSATGIVNVPDRLPSAAETIAEVYRAAGYATWASAGNAFAGRLSNLHQGVEVMHEPGSVVLPPGVGASKNARTYVDRLLPWLELHKDTPFFVFLHFLDPHPPFETYAPYNSQWADGSWRDEQYAEMSRVRKFIKPGSGIRRRLVLATAQELDRAGVDKERFVQREEAWYDGSISAMDAELAKVFAKLDELGLNDRVVVAFLSDHGEEFLDHGMHFNGNNLYGENTNVPLVLWGPGRIPVGKKVAETVQSIDLAPTLIELSGLDIPETMMGQSLLPLLSDGNRRRRRPVVSERIHNVWLNDYTANGTAVVWEGWKLIHNDADRPPNRPEYELFHHQEDPWSLHDVAAEHPEKVEELAELLKSWRRWVDSEQLPTDAELTQGVSGEELERLRSLGYVQ